LVQIDVLINNAAISLPNHGETDDFPSSTDPRWMTQLFETNVAGTLQVTQAMLPLLTSRQPSPATFAKVINISSYAGSIARVVRDPTEMPFYTAYATSKAALNMVTAHLAAEFKQKPKNAMRDIAFLAIDPGWVATDMGCSGDRVPPTSPIESVLAMMSIVDTLDLERSGSFLSSDGSAIAW
jgi:NAD(P)-dependent dehydrogenase (short-subunit alcohol dehydrogenase family)